MSGQELRQLRLEQRVSRKILASWMRVSQVRLGQIERKPSVRESTCLRYRVAIDTVLAFRVSMNKIEQARQVEAER